MKRKQTEPVHTEVELHCSARPFLVRFFLSIRKVRPSRFVVADMKAKKTTYIRLSLNQRGHFVVQTFFSSSSSSSTKWCKMFHEKLFFLSSTRKKMNGLYLLTKHYTHKRWCQAYTQFYYYQQFGHIPSPHSIRIAMLLYNTYHNISEREPFEFDHDF